MLSASRVQQPQEIVLYHEGLQFSGEGWELVKDLPQLKLVPIEDSLFSDLPDSGFCLQLFHELKSPASRANLLRLAVLYRWGGVYLDTDVIAVKPWDELLNLPGFCGVEPVALPAYLFESFNPLYWMVCGLRYSWRYLCTFIPRGEQWFRLFERNYAMAANNAVIGAEPGNPLLQKAFTMIAQMDPATQRKRFRLGTHLLQQLTENRSSPHMTVFSSRSFYPVGPVVSCHWFCKGSARRLDKMLFPETKVVHWYNSVEARYLKEPLNAQWVERNPTTAFAELVRRFAG